MLLKRTIRIFLSLVALTVLFSGTVTAQETAPADDWQFNADIYLWYASIGGTAVPGSDVDIGADDLIDALEMGFMGAFGARKGKWSFMADVIYLDASDDTDVAPGAKINVELTGWIVTPLVGYNILETDKARIDLVAGARYLYLKADVTLVGLAAVSDHGHTWDGVAGVRGEVNLTEKWYIPFYGDIGTGESDLTWQVLGGIGYRFEKFDVVVAYRYLDWEFDDSKVFDDLNVSGPLAGIKIRF